MSITSGFIESHLNEILGYDMSEEHAELLFEWYGDDLSLFNPDDEDLAAAIRNLRMNDLFWRISNYVTSPYEKLRLKYDALLESYISLCERYGKEG